MYRDRVCSVPALEQSTRKLRFLIEFDGLSGIVVSRDESTETLEKEIPQFSFYFPGPVSGRNLLTAGVKRIDTRAGTREDGSLARFKKRAV